MSEPEPRDEVFLVTGALGCLGAWTCRELVRDGAGVVAFDLGTSRHRLELIMSEDEIAAIDFVSGDVTDLEAIERALEAHGVTQAVHLAAMQVPFAKADPPRSAQVNVAGTVNVFEAVARRGLAGLAYASSAAVFRREDGPFAAAGAEGHPVNHYGVHKLANEGAAGVYWRDEHLASVGLRPCVIYGPGRDQGMTAGPSLAMAAAAAGEPFHIAFGGRTQLQYAPDAARAFVGAARDPGEGASVHNLGGPVEHVADVVAAIEAVVPEAAGRITFDSETLLPLPEEFEGPARPWWPVTPLADGVRETIARMRAAAPA